MERALERLEDLRQEMIAKLDAADGDADLEPSLEPGYAYHHAARLGPDLEGDDCDAEESDHSGDELDNEEACELEVRGESDCGGACGTVDDEAEPDFEPEDGQ